MKKLNNYINEVKKMLDAKGVIERKHASTIATILGIRYNSAKQKLDGKRGITLEEMNTVFNYFNEGFLNTKTHNCVFIMNSIHKRCNVQVEKVSNNATLDRSEHYAVQQDGLYIVNTNSDNNIPNEKLLKVNSIDFLPEPLIAILDNDEDILHLIEKITNRYGIKANIFSSINELEASTAVTSYDAFILDWQLDFGATPENMIKKINNTQKPQPLIIVLTGQLEHYEKTISEMIMGYDIHLIEKPTKPLIISSLLLSKLFFN